MRIVLSGGLAAAVLVGATSHASDYPANRYITTIGCHQTDGTCFVNLDGAAFGASEGCVQGGSNQFRFDNADTPNGRRTYASLLSAYLAKKRVDVAISGCSSQGVPTLTYFLVRD
jgi:hypothetical protein